MPVRLVLKRVYYINRASTIIFFMRARQKNWNNKRVLLPPGVKKNIHELAKVK